ncbi:MAG: hypothetical protein OXI22_03540, partial [Defluviicoccus sp.]|nr:hypothetical protein [Defluviicoccus sp.]MDE0382934.1 hypothetical protein [Defluviicoccus sp.]
MSVFLLGLPAMLDHRLGQARAMGGGLDASVTLANGVPARRRELSVILRPGVRTLLEDAGRG